MKLSDYVIQFLEELKIKDVFLLSGGGMMHLLDSLSCSDKIKAYYNLNEQATSICADAYAQYTNELSVCMVTTGPGGTNAITGVVSAYQDSTPILVLSGQVKTSDLAPEGVRVYGAQEVNIIGLVEKVTKYAVLVKDAEKIGYYLEKAVYLATHGRRGPVWIDVPLDIQAAEINPEKLEHFRIEKEKKEEIDFGFIKEFSLAKKPLLLLGHGVIAAKAQEEVKKLMEIMKIPVLATWRAKELFCENEKYFFGFPGSQAPRYSNFILQDADYILIVGSRLDWSLTAYDESNFAPKAKKVIVDIEQAEMDKLHIQFERKIVSDAKEFVCALLKEIENKFFWKDIENWYAYCVNKKENYPIYNEKMDFGTDKIYGYDFAKVLSKCSNETDVFVASPTGRVCIAMNLGIQLKEGQRFIAPRGLGAMGYAVPCAIAACIASGFRRTICLEGDGSLQHNIQELQLLKTYHLPVKLFIYNNGGYSSIYGMQKAHFNSRLSGCTSENGVAFPELEKIAYAYDIEYFRINSNMELETGIKKVLASKGAVICEVMGDIRYEEIPRTQTKVMENGKIISGKLENLYPFLKE